MFHTLCVMTASTPERKSFGIVVCAGEGDSNQLQEEGKVAQILNGVSMIDLQDLGHLDWKGLSACVCELERERERERVRKYPSEKDFQ